MLILQMRILKYIEEGQVMILKIAQSWGVK